MSVFDEIAIELVASELATEVSYQTQGGSTLQVRGIVMRTNEDEQRATGVYARLFVSLADFPESPACGDSVSVDGETYKVFDVSIETGGGVRLLLREVI